MAPRVKKDNASAAPVVEAAAPSPVKAAKAPKAAKAVEAPAPVVEAAPVAAEAASAETAVAGSAESFKALLELVNELRHKFTEVSAHLKATQRAVDRELKQAKKNKKRERKTGSRNASGFAKPTAITDELAVFLGLEKGTLVSRTDVTNGIHNYVVEHKLQNPGNGRKINPDAKLRKLLALKADDELDYFNLQKHLSKLFPKKAAVQSA